MPRYKDLDSRTKWRYLGIREYGFDPKAQEKWLSEAEKILS